MQGLMANCSMCGVGEGMLHKKGCVREFANRVPHTKAERINRLRARLREIKPPNTTPQLVSVLHGVLDLLSDEL